MQRKVQIQKGALPEGLMQRGELQKNYVKVEKPSKMYDQITRNSEYEFTFILCVPFK